MNTTQSYRAVRQVVFLFFTLFIFLFKFRLDGNEIDVLPYARAFFNPQWLSADWYLHLNIPYRFIFSYPVGFAAETYGWIPTLVVGRLLAYALFAFALYRLKKVVVPKVSFVVFLIAIVLFVLLFHHGFGAKEWIVGGFDTKVFAYSFALLSLTFAFEIRWPFSLALAGLALSFHLLIGAYHLFCLAPILLYSIVKSEVQWRGILIGAGLFVLLGSSGLSGVIQQLTQATFPNSSALWKLYVEFRVPHHTLPSEFPKTWPLLLSLFLGFNLFLFFRSKRRINKLLSAYALSSIFSAYSA